MRRSRPPDLQERANDLIEFYRDKGEHPDINRGEIETYFMARHLRDEGQEPLVISDDRLAKELCRAHSLPYIDTPTLVIQMVCEDVLTKAEGGLIWRACFENNRAAWKGYDTRLLSTCGK